MRAQVTKLKRVSYLEECDAIIREQLEQGVVGGESHSPQVVGREVYTPHRAVIREGTESTKLRIVYDCSARAGQTLPSLNDCLDPGPPLQNKLWDIMVRGRFHPVAVTGVVCKAFLEAHKRRGTGRAQISLAEKSYLHRSRNTQIHSNVVWFGPFSFPAGRCSRTTP